MQADHLWKTWKCQGILQSSGNWPFVEEISGKTVLRTTCIHQCCNWWHRQMLHARQHLKQAEKSDYGTAEDDRKQETW